MYTVTSGFSVKLTNYIFVVATSIIYQFQNVTLNQYFNQWGQPPYGAANLIGNPEQIILTIRVGDKIFHHPDSR